MRAIIPIRVGWDYTDEVYITTLDELEIKLEELGQEADSRGFPFALQVELDDGSGDGLFVMVGSDYSVLSYFSNITKQVVRNAVGDPEDGTILVPHSFRGSYTEPRRSHMIPTVQAHAALKDYVLYKHIPDDIEFD